MFGFSILIAETLTFFSLDTLEERKLPLLCVRWTVAEREQAPVKFVEVCIKKK